MDEQGFKSWLTPMLIQVLTGLGKYVVAPLAALTGAQEAQVGNWWTATASLLGGLAVGIVCHLLASKHILTKAADQTDAKIADNDKL